MIRVRPTAPVVRVVVLLTAATGAFVRSLGYVNPPTSKATSFIDGLLPITAWAVIWAVAGVVALAGLWHRSLAKWALNIIAALWFTWMLSYIVATTTGDFSRGWLTAGGFFVIAAYTWTFAYLIDRPGRAGEPWNG